jgi:hypothetical protein
MEYTIKWYEEVIDDMLLTRKECCESEDQEQIDYFNELCEEYYSIEEEHNKLHDDKKYRESLKIFYNKINNE